LNNINDFFYSVNKCPICDSTNFDIENKNIKNRYSEEVSRLLNISEEKLIDTLLSIRCNNCNLGYKNLWFKKDVYYEIFINSSPYHPQGWDSVSSAFTKKRFIKSINLLQESIINNDNTSINKYERTILSYINNISDKYIIKNNIQKLVQKAIKINYQTLNNEDYSFLVKDIATNIIEPKELGRFSGYKNKDISLFFQENIPTFDTYGEIGSPLWGMFDIYNKTSSKKLYFFQDEDKTFWGEEDKYNGVLSYDYAKINFNVEVTRLSEFSKLNKKLDFINMIHYLDHNSDPVDLLKRLSKVTKYLMIISHIDTPSLRVVQHFTNFNNTVFEYLAKKLNFKIINILNNKIIYGILIKFNE